MGKSGSGKSTLLSLLAGLDLPKSREVLYKGQPTSGMDLDRYRREDVAVIYQNYKLFPMLTVMENIIYPMELRGIKRKEAEQQAKTLLSKVMLSEELLPKFPAMLSGGEQQRVAIARALSLSSKLLLGDEPTGNLDTENSDNIIELLIRLAHEEKYCVIIATHDVSVLDRMDEVYRVKDGRLENF
ncbi:MAG: ATP-binding cassette domain-containing protein [Lachnospiraceae bacterium]|nr:ATP-binding cassette domain-containing protein [Lachnospiraceae bacterium]